MTGKVMKDACSRSRRIVTLGAGVSLGVELNASTPNDLAGIELTTNTRILCPAWNNQEVGNISNFNPTGSLGLTGRCSSTTESSLGT